MPSKDHQAVIKHQLTPTPNVTKASEKFLIPVDDDMGQ